MSKLSVTLYKKGKYEVNLPEGIATALYDEFVKKSMEVDSLLRDLTPEVYGVPKRDIALPVSAEEIVGIDTEQDEVFGETSISENSVNPKSEKEDHEDITPKERVKFTRDPEFGAERNVKYDQLGYKGFLRIKCEECGIESISNAREPITERLCHSCGHSTRLHNLVYLNVDCQVCGSHFSYRTNIVDPETTIQCLNCKSEVDIFYHRKSNCYLTSGRVPR